MGISLGISPTLANTIPYYAVILGVHLGPFPYSLLHYYIPLVIYGVQGSVHHMYWWCLLWYPKQASKPVSKTGLCLTTGVIWGAILS